MKKKIIFLLIAVAFASCQKEAKDNKEENQESTTQEFVDEHTAEKSLDYVGSYSGDIPCANCDFIRFKVQLEADYTFFAKYIYKGSNNEVFEEKGAYKWIENGSIIHLISDDEKSEYKFKVMENQLLMFSRNGELIDSALKEKYILNKS